MLSYVVQIPYLCFKENEDRLFSPRHDKQAGTGIGQTLFWFERNEDSANRGCVIRPPDK